MSFAPFIGVSRAIAVQFHSEFGAYIAAESEKWAKVMQFAGIKPECFRLIGATLPLPLLR
jgi:hypothetical protein